MHSDPTTVLLFRLQPPPIGSFFILFLLLFYRIGQVVIGLFSLANGEPCPRADQWLLPYWLLFSGNDTAHLFLPVSIQWAPSLSLQYFGIDARFDTASLALAISRPIPLLFSTISLFIQPFSSYTKRSQLLGLLLGMTWCLFDLSCCVLCVPWFTTSRIP